MSSHHIVREKQEPALLIIHFDDFEEENLGQLLEWSPTVLVTSELFAHIDSLGIKIDIVLEEETEAAHPQEHIKHLHTGGDVLEAALKYLVAESYPAVNIITREFILKDYLFFADLIDLVIFTSEKKIYPVRSGFNKWKPAGEKISVPASQPGVIETIGLKKTGDYEYETTKDGFMALAFSQPFLFIAEDL